MDSVSPMEENLEKEGEYVHQPGDILPHIFIPLYSAFLSAFHSKNVHQKQCKISDHMARFETPPTYEGKTFQCYNLFHTIKEMGGFKGIKSWSDLARRIGLNPKNSNISTRMREWAEKHHVPAFFDFLLGIPNDYYSPIADSDIVYPSPDAATWRKLMALDTTAVIEQNSTSFNEPLSKKVKHEDLIINDNTAVWDDKFLESLSMEERRFIHRVDEKLKAYKNGTLSSEVVSNPESSLPKLNTPNVDENGERALDTIIPVPSSAEGGKVIVVASSAPTIDGLRSRIHVLNKFKDSIHSMEFEAIKISDVGHSKLVGEVVELYELLEGQRKLVDNIRIRIDE